MVMPGNHSMTCGIEAPFSRFSNSAATGTRVPRNTQAPETRSGSRSTAEQVDQSIIEGMLALASRPPTAPDPGVNVEPLPRPPSPRRAPLNLRSRSHRLHFVLVGHEIL